MGNLSKTKNGDLDKQVEVILNILYAIKDDGKFYFDAYGKDIIKRLVNDYKKKSNEKAKL